MRDRLRSKVALFFALTITPLEIVIAQGANAQTETAMRAQGRISGRIVNAQTGASVARAELLLLRGVDTLARGRCDSVGGFTASGTVGEQFTLEVRRLGYLPAQVPWTARARDTSIVVGLTPTAQSLDTVAVVERESAPMRLKGFEYRAAGKAGGTYIHQEQIDAWNPRQTSDLMRRVLGVRLVDGSGMLLAASSRGQKVHLAAANMARSWAPCIMCVAVDGNMKEWGFSMDAIDPKSIHGIEVYNGPASIPSEFSGTRTDSYCGLVTIWTR
jgi:hypothetical protein